MFQKLFHHPKKGPSQRKRSTKKEEETKEKFYRKFVATKKQSSQHG